MHSNKTKRLLQFGTKSVVFLVTILFLLGLGLILFFDKGEGTIESRTIVYVNGKAIKYVDYQLRLRDASLVLPGQEAENLKRRVLEDMINAELLYQEAVRRYGDLPRVDAIRKLMKEEVESPNARESDERSKIERKKAELEIYRKFVLQLRSDAKIEFVSVVDTKQ